jgi:uncharacterized protein (DUF2384 family)
MNERDLVRALTRKTNLPEAAVAAIVGETVAALRAEQGSSPILRQPAWKQWVARRRGRLSPASDRKTMRQSPSNAAPVAELFVRRITLRGTIINEARYPLAAEEMRLASPASVPRVSHHLVADLHDPDSGRLDAKRIAHYLDVPLKALAGAVGRDYSTIAKTPNAGRIQERLAHIERIAAAFNSFPEPMRAMRQWLNGPHPDLGGKTPMSFLLQGHAAGIADMIIDRQLGQPG